MAIVFDIETVGFDFDSLTDSQKEFLLRYAEKESDQSKRQEMTDEAIRYLSLYPFTARIVSIGMLNTETENSLVLYEGSDEEWEIEEKKIKYSSCSEFEMISKFWKYVSNTDKVITFNGRQFDIPFLMLRSAILKIKPSVNFIGNRYNTAQHIDLLEKLTFYGLIRKFNLDFYCHSFGIESPKSKGVSGMEVKELYKAGRIKDIAIYCGEDVKATFKLFEIWHNYLDV